MTQHAGWTGVCEIQLWQQDNQWFAQRQAISRSVFFPGQSILTHQCE